jgi:probable blue pigment (indigoidine) exporter
MNRFSDLLLTALAPAIWGSTYIVTTNFLPDGYPITVSLLRALPAGLLLLLIVRTLPQGIWWYRAFLLGALNFAFFWSLLFLAAYRLPGGVAATVGAVQPLFVIFLARILMGSEILLFSIVAAVVGIGGVSLLLLSPEATLDPIGVIVGLGGALSMAAGTVLSRKWKAPVSLLTFTSWQLTAGGILLIPVAILMEPDFPSLNSTNILGLTYLGLIGAALTYVIWFRGISKIEPSVISTLGFLSPVTAVILGWAFMSETLNALQIAGAVTILMSVFLSQQAAKIHTLKPIFTPR